MNVQRESCDEIPYQCAGDEPHLSLDERNVCSGQSSDILHTSSNREVSIATIESLECTALKGTLKILESRRQNGDRIAIGNFP
jgi:hypothetical protein